MPHIINDSWDYPIERTVFVPGPSNLSQPASPPLPLLSLHGAKKALRVSVRHQKLLPLIFYPNNGALLRQPKRLQPCHGKHHLTPILCNLWHCGTPLPQESIISPMLLVLIKSKALPRIRRRPPVRTDGLLSAKSEA
jgi:hypothetical protein